MATLEVRELRAALTAIVKLTENVPEAPVQQVNKIASDAISYHEAPEDVGTKPVLWEVFSMKLDGIIAKQHREICPIIAWSGDNPCVRLESGELLVVDHANSRAGRAII